MMEAALEKKKKLIEEKTTMSLNGTIIVKSSSKARFS
jgi:hypothetical protein